MTDTKLVELQHESSQLTIEAQKYDVVNQTAYSHAGNFLKQCINLKKQIELFFEPTIENFKKAKAEADAGRKAEIDRMNRYLSPVEEAINIVQRKCKDFENEAEKKRLEEQKIKDEEAKKQAEIEKAWGEENPVVEAEKAKPVIAKVSGLGIRRTWQWKIVNEELIPREYLKIDEVAINKVVREQQGNTKIEGIEVFYD